MVRRLNARFATFEAQVSIGLNLALSGVPHWGIDIGGFYLVAPDQGELFVRWLQFGAFCSIFRAHGHSWRRHVPPGARRRDRGDLPPLYRASQSADAIYLYQPA